MVEEATQCTSEPRRHNFYPSPTEALGCDASLYTQQYPQVYFGHAKNGCPVFYSKPARMEIKAVESLTSLANIINFHWNAMMHDLVRKFKDQYVSSDGKFKRYEIMCIMDLKDLSSSQLAKRPLKLVKEQSAIDSLCFPETLNHMAVVNAPGFFALTWKLIKSWIDQRTASKVSVIPANKEKVLNHLTKYIDKGSLPSDYGGDGASINDVLKKDTLLRLNSGTAADSSNFTVKNKNGSLISLRGKTSETISVDEGVSVNVSFSTRSLDGGNVIIKDDEGNRLTQVPESGICLRHKGLTEEDENELPTFYDLEQSHGITLNGPGKYKIELESNSSKSKTVYIILVTTEFTKKPPAAVVNPKDLSQAGDQGELLVSSQSICTGIFGSEDINLIRPTPIVRTDKKNVFGSEITVVKPTSKVIEVAQS